MATPNIMPITGNLTAGSQPPSGMKMSPQGTAGNTATAIPFATPQAQPGASTAGNPYVPPTFASTITGTNTTGGAITPNSGDPNQNLLQKQLTDIYGKGIGGELTSLLGSISGTDSQALQEYIASLQPQEAKAAANVNATLGAQGVSANSSVNAIAQSNLQAQETASIAGESAQLQTQEQQLEAGILSGTESAAAKEVASSGWSVFGDVLGALGSDASKVFSVGF